MKDALIGTRINRYEIREAIHKSDVISIYKAYDTKLERFVLIKTIIHSSEYTKEAVDHFLAESKVLAKLAHPNIAKVLDFGYENGNLYLISELVTGIPLSDLLNNPLPWQQAINIILPLTDALIYAHSRGIIHRDIKPANIIIDNDHQPILSDFSLMRIIEEEETRDMTGTNVGLGSPEYISPEQGQGLTVDFRADIYSLGVIFFEMVTGKKLFYASSSMEIVLQHIMADPPKPRSIIPTLPKMVEVVILNALSKEPEKRYQSMEEFSNAIKAIIEASNRDKNRRFRRPKRLVTSLIIGFGLLLLALGLFIQNRYFNAPATTVSQINVPTSQTDVAGTTASPTSRPEIQRSATQVEIPSLVNDPFSNYHLPVLPVLAGTKLPASNQTLTVDNINAIQEIARWEKPDIRQLALINNDQVLLAATSAGIYYYNPNDLSAQLFFDTQGAVSTFAVSDDGQWVATANQNGVIAIWNIMDGQLLYQLQDKDYKASTIKSMDFSPDKLKLVFCDTNKTIHFWNIKQNQYYPFDKALSANANKVLFVDGDETVVSGGEENRFMFWDVATADLKQEMNLPASQTINDMALSANDRYLAAALDEAIIEVWDRSTNQKNTIKDPTIVEAFTSITFLKNQEVILTGSADGFIRIWNIAGSSPLWEVTSDDQSKHPEAVNPVRSIVVTQDGTRFVVEFANGTIETWDLVDKERQKSEALGTIPIKRVAVSPDDHLLALQRGESHVDMLNISNDSQRIRIDGTLPRGNPISPNSQMISIVPPGHRDQLRIYPLSQPLPTIPPSPQFIYDFPVFGSVNYSPDNNILSAFGTGNFSYWSTSSGRELKEALPKRVGLCYTIYRRDGHFIAAASENGVIFSDENLDFYCQIRRDARTTSEMFLPNGSIIALSMQNQRIEVWKVQIDNKWALTIRTPGNVLGIAISKDGKLLATASAGGTIEIYDLEKEKILKTLEIGTGPVNQVVFTNDIKYLIAGMEDGTLRIFGLYP